MIITNSYTAVIIVIMVIAITRTIRFPVWWKNVPQELTCCTTLDSVAFSLQAEVSPGALQVLLSMNFPLFWSFLTDLCLLSLFSFRARPE